MTSVKEVARVTTPTDREIHIERIFNATRERVWRAMTDPELVAQWWGRGNKLVIERMQLERGYVGRDASPEVCRNAFAAMGPGKEKVARRRARLTCARCPARSGRIPLRVDGRRCHRCRPWPSCPG